MNNTISNTVSNTMSATELETMSSIMTTKYFDKLDNTIVGTTRDIAKATKLSQSNVTRVLRSLKKQDLLREVLNVSNDKVLMLSPSVYCTMYPVEEHFHKAMFVLGSHKLAGEFTQVERDLGTFIDAETGEELSVIPKSYYLLFETHINNESQERSGMKSHNRRVYNKAMNDSVNASQVKINDIDYEVGMNDSVEDDLENSLEKDLENDLEGIVKTTSKSDRLALAYAFITEQSKLDFADFR